MKRVISIFLVFLIFFSSLSEILTTASTLSTEPTVQVKLVNYLGNQTQISVKTIGDYVIDSSNGLKLESGTPYVLRIEHGKMAIMEGVNKIYESTEISLNPVQYSNNLLINNRSYHGSFRFIIENGYVRPINTLFIEDYLKGVVPHEMYNSWPREALKVQAVAARTYAMNSVNKVINDTISYQVYGGYYWYNNSSAAVDETIGEILTFNNVPIGTAAVYSASNGGMSESNSNAWGNAPLSYLPIQEDPFDSKSPWSLSIRKQQINTTNLNLNQIEWWGQISEENPTISTSIKKWLNQNGYPGKELKIIAIPKLSLHTVRSGGRVSRGDITIEFFVKDKFNAEGNLELQRLVLTNKTASTIRSIVGLSVMPSYLISNQLETDEFITISGYGNGHGVGMSQWGAKNRADAGQTYQSILAFYYPGTVKVKNYVLANRESMSQPVVNQPVDQSPPPEQEKVNPPTAQPVEPIKPVAPPVPVIKPEILKLSVTTNYNTNHATISYYVNKEVKVTSKVMDTKGKVVATIQSNQAITRGIQNRNWSFSKLGNGTYTVIVQAVDGANNQYSAKTNVHIKKYRTGTVTASSLVVRSSASTKGKRVGALKRNQKVTIVSTSGDWYKIQFGKSYGFVSKRYIK
ncbi:SpoIID/LytB domain-containing protein [Bacillus pinisoli]|uniref:SpoIID/LytB domain-containing protein n=1 Tax=Bacillus pinisoli TaxID=2901866 RepID=UPI001FF19946|nr:SpoIID/LytB domain-containing protein [Bacillus pinisoli]